MNGWSERLERIRRWRETLVSLAVIAVGLSVVVNLLATSLYEGNWKIAALFVVLTGTLLAIATNFLYRQFAADGEAFECIIPVAIDPGKEEIHILSIPPYPCSSAMHHATTVAIRRESELKQSLLEAYARRTNTDPFHCPQPLWVFLHNLMFYQLIDAFRVFANKSLGHGAVHGPWASLALQLDKERQRVRDVEGVLWATMKRFKEPASEELAIHLPPETTISASMDSRATVPSGFVVTTPYATLAVTISRHWSNASLSSKTGRIVRRLASQLPAQHELLRRIEKGQASLWIGRIPVTVGIRFRPLWIFARKAEPVFAWGVESVEFLRDRVAWSSVLADEMERLLVELHEKIESIQDVASIKQQ